MANQLQIVSTPEPQLGSFIEAYKRVHRNPDLSQQEFKTANLAAKHLLSEIFEVSEGVDGYSTVGVLRNGPGRKVTLRTDMDALPILEETSLPYASEQRMTDLVDGRKKPVMHTRDHDMHTVSLMAVVSCLSAAREHWPGTLICLFQSDEEVGAGARSMIAQGLYDKVPRLTSCSPNTSSLFAPVRYQYYPVLYLVLSTTSNTSFGKDGYASRPDGCVDPIVLASHIIVRLQSLVSQGVPPQSAAVFTC